MWYQHKHNKKLFNFKKNRFFSLTHKSQINESLNIGRETSFCFIERLIWKQKEYLHFDISQKDIPNYFLNLGFLSTWLLSWKNTSNSQYSKDNRQHKNIYPYLDFLFDVSKIFQSDSLKDKKIYWLFKGNNQQKSWLSFQFFENIFSEQKEYFWICFELNKKSESETSLSWFFNTTCEFNLEDNNQDIKNWNKKSKINFLKNLKWKPILVKIRKKDNWECHPSLPWEKHQLKDEYYEIIYQYEYVESYELPLNFQVDNLYDYYAMMDNVVEIYPVFQSNNNQFQDFIGIINQPWTTQNNTHIQDDNNLKNNIEKDIFSIPKWKNFSCFYMSNKKDWNYTIKDISSFLKFIQPSQTEQWQYKMWWQYLFCRCLPIDLKKQEYMVSITSSISEKRYEEQNTINNIPNWIINVFQINKKTSLIKPINNFFYTIPEHTLSFFWFDENKVYLMNYLYHRFPKHITIKEIKNNILTIDIDWKCKEIQNSTLLNDISIALNPFGYFTNIESHNWQSIKIQKQTKTEIKYFFNFNLNNLNFNIISYDTYWLRDMYFEGNILISPFLTWLFQSLFPKNIQPIHLIDIIDEKHILYFLNQKGKTWVYYTHGLTKYY